jgi:predicted DNA-binding antitoxin AbrB/MazE fold protein
MSTVDAIYSGGVFRPLNEVPIAENQCVRLTIETAPVGEVSSWLAAVQQFQTDVIDRHGVLPDSTPEI